ncbi:HAD family phosphatase [Candidatus Micrarchaeota archaeon]|nr:HAD family phosphatase [Candidatus Micrarchaeota archaeon]
MICAILFDFDGVVIKSELLHRKSFLELLKPYGINVSIKRWYKEFAGTGSRSIIERLLKEHKIDADIDQMTKKRKEIYELKVKNGELSEMPGVRKFLEELEAKGVKRAIVSGSHRTNVMLALKTLDLERYFGSYIVSGDDLKERKPAPEPFLAGARLIGAKPDECIAFEDSPAGAQSARNAEMKLIIVKSPAAENVGKYDLLITNFTKKNRKKIWDLINKN